MGGGGGLVPIGRFSAICRLTIKALRHYDDLGLLKPALVDPHSGYRYYRLNQASDADLIRTLRAAEMPLDEIGAVLRAADPAAARDLLTRHRQRLHDRIAAQHGAMAALERLLNREETTMTYTIEVSQVPQQLLASTRLTISPDELSVAIPRAMEEAMGYLQRHGAQPVGPPVALYHEGGPEAEAMAIEVGWPVAASLPTEGTFGMGAFGGVAVARTILVGPYDQIPSAWIAVSEWMQAHGHESAGPPWEWYTTDPGDVSDPQDYRTEICWPIR